MKFRRGDVVEYTDTSHWPYTEETNIGLVRSISPEGDIATVFLFASPGRYYWSVDRLRLVYRAQDTATAD